MYTSWNHATTPVIHEEWRGEWNKADLQLDFLFDEILRNHEDWLCGEIIKDPMAYLNS